MTLLRADVFTPGKFPAHNYVECAGENREDMLRQALEAAGRIVALSGPSKSGKTVLVQRVVGFENLIPVQGSTITREEDVWDRVLDWMEAPVSLEEVVASRAQFGGQLGGSLSGGLPVVAKASTEMSVSGQLSEERGSRKSFRRGGLPQVVREVADSDYILFVDDFHYIPRAVQVDVARSLKSAVQSGVRVATASIPHREDDVLRANPDLRGRVKALDVGYWSLRDLRRIADLGFEKLNVSLPSSVIDSFAKEAAGSPQLLQLLCLEACVALRIPWQVPRREERLVEFHTLREIFDSVAESITFRSVIDFLSSRAASQHSDKRYVLRAEESAGTIGRCLLRAIGADPMQAVYSVDELHERSSQLAVGNGPTVAAVMAGCQEMVRVAREQFVAEQLLHWDDDRESLIVDDPYFLFYLRWSRYVRTAR